MKTLLLACILFPVQSLLLNSSAVAQPMVYTTTPLQTNGDRFFESTNMNWSLRGPNFSASFGGPNIGVPRFGGYNPNAGISSGWAFNSGRFSGTFGFNFSQGYERFSTTTAPSLMTTNGQTGQFFSGVRRPFVYSLVPVVPPGGAFFSSPCPAFQQQYRLPSSLAERVLRGDVVLPESRSAAQQGNTSNVSHPGTASADPAAARRNAAYAWFNDKAATRASTNKPQPTPSNVPSSDLDVPTDRPVENQAAIVARQIAPTKPGASPASTVANSNSQRIAEVYYQRGLDAEAGNNVAKATFLFRIAAERASGELRDRIEKHRRKLQPQ
ncbi:MAG: hypothetical protein ACI8P0_001159 [Planctomycetaceae bacterium]|jgi:hypothetical protein